MDRQRLSRTLIKHEALRLEPYRCSAGKLTIGVGHNLDDNGISGAIALALLKEDIQNSEEQLRRFFFFELLSDVRQEVLLNLHFNIGHSAFKRFKKMILNLGRGDFEKAADEMMDSRWYHQVGKRAVYLVRAMRNNKFEE